MKKKLKIIPDSERSTQLISLRLPYLLLEDIKMIANKNDVSYKRKCGYQDKVARNDDFFVFG